MKEWKTNRAISNTMNKALFRRKEPSVGTYIILGKLCNVLCRVKNPELVSKDLHLERENRQKVVWELDGGSDTKEQCGVV